MYTCVHQSLFHWASKLGVDEYMKKQTNFNIHKPILSKCSVFLLHNWPKPLKIMSYKTFSAWDNCMTFCCNAVPHSIRHINSYRLLPDYQKFIQFLWLSFCCSCELHLWPPGHQGNQLCWLKSSRRVYLREGL